MAEQEAILHSGQAPPSLAAFLSRRFAVVVLLQTALIALFVGMLQWAQAARQERDANVTLVRNMGERIDTFTGRRQQVLGHLASLLPQIGEKPERLDALLGVTLIALDGAATAIAIDDKGRIVAGVPDLLTADGASVWAGVSVADRDYFKVPMQRGGSFVSPLFRGRGFGRDLLFAISTATPQPKAVRGNVAVIEASLPLSLLKKQANELFTGSGREYAVMSPGGVVATSSDSLNWPAFSILSDSLVQRIDALPIAHAQWLEDPSLGPQRWLVSRLELKDNWGVLVMMSRSAFVSQVLGSLVWPIVACLLVGALLLLGVRMTARRLGAQGDRFAARIESLTPEGLGGTTIGWREPRVAFREAGRVYRAVASLVRRMQFALADQQATSAQLEGLRASLQRQVEVQEAEIQSRTAMLLVSSAELRNSQQLLEDAQVTGRIGMWSWIPGSQHVYLSSGAQRLLDTPPMREHVPLSMALASVVDEDRERAIATFEGCRTNNSALAITFQVCDDRGRNAWLLMRGAHGRASGSSDWVFRGTVLDISDRYLAERRLTRFAGGVEQLCRAALTEDAPAQRVHAMLNAARIVAGAARMIVVIQYRDDERLMTLDQSGVAVPMRRRNEYPPDLLKDDLIAGAHTWQGENVLLVRAASQGCTVAMMFAGLDGSPSAAEAAVAMLQLAARLIAQTQSDGAEPNTACAGEV